METTALNITKTGIKLNQFLILFLLFWFLSQLFSSSAPLISFTAFFLSLAMLLLILLFGSRNEIFLFLFVTTAMSITIPFAPQRELELILPIGFLLFSLVRFAPKFLHIKKEYAHPLLFSIILFLTFCFIGVFNGIKIPGINASDGENSGLLNRFNLFNSVVIFINGLVLFDPKQSEQWAKYFFRFYLIVLAVSMLIILFEIGPFPLFNTFSWSLIFENEGSKKMPIAGVAGSFVLMCTLIFVTNKWKFLFFVLSSLLALLISGSRISFLAGLVMIFMSFVVRRKVLGKSIVILTISAFGFFYLLLSPVILLVPERYQRLVILFPPEYYTGKLAHLSESAAASSSSFRQDIWSRASVKIAEHPLIGNSFDAPKADYNFGGDLMQGFQKIPTDILHNDFLVTGSLHNTFFGIAYLLGIPALILFVWFLFRLTWLHYKMSMRFGEMKKRVALFITILLINYIVFAMVTDLIFDLQFFLTFAVALKILFFYYQDGEQIAV